MTITLEQIKSLRDKTGVSTMAVKNALVEADGDEDKAIDILRKKGEAKAAKRSDRSTAHGAVAVALSQGKAAMIALACETDFVAKNDDFIAKVQGFADTLLADGEDTDLTEVVTELGLKMGEKIEVHSKKVVEAPMISSYIHSNHRIGVLVAMTGGEEALGQDIAMHVAAMNPQNVSPDDVSEELVAKEKEIWTEELAQAGKPAEIIEKIMIGKEKKFREEFALLTQPFVKNPEQKIHDLLGDVGIEGFWRVEV